jgi:TonB-dependent receptor
MPNNNSRASSRWAFIAAVMAAVLLPQVVAAQTGSISGRVVDAQSAQPLVSAQVFVADGQGTLTNLDGAYILRNLPVGTYDLQVQLIGYALKTVTGVSVSAGQVVTVDITMASSAIDLEGITVSAAAERGSTTSLLLERARSVVVQDAIGADQISRSPDGDAAAALKRVPGLSVVDGKFAYVRGLGERYSSTTLNGAPLASPIPDKKVIPLDLFPSGFLESIVTAKSYSPDQPGDYAGGLVQLKTKAFPAQRTLSVSVSGGWNSVATFEDGLGYAGGANDFFGFDDGTRALPAEIPRDRPLNSSAFAQADLFDIGRTIGGDWGPTAQTDLPPNTSIGISYGDDIGLGNERRLGFIASANFSNSVARQQDLIERVFSATGVSDPEVDYLGQVTTRSATVGAMFNAAYQFSPTQQVRFSSVYNHSADDIARELEGFNLDSNTDQLNTRLQFLAQSLLNLQLNGEHVVPFLNDGKLEWRGGLSRAGRYEPNTREVLYRRAENGRFVYDNFVQSGSIFHQDMVDDGLSAGLDLDIPFEFAAGAAELSFGGSWSDRQRDTFTRRFRYIPAPGAVLDDDFRSQTPNELFVPGNIGPAGFIIAEATFRADNYDGSETIGAGYAKLDLTLTERLRVSGGVRYETTDQVTTPRDFFDTAIEPLPGANQSQRDLLPALNVTYALADNMNLRGSASRTLARPQLRELAPFSFADYAGGFLVSGNPQVNRSLIDNFDARWEWFPTPNTVIATSGFYKRFQDPIEVLVLPSSELIKSWVNADEAINYGAEFEARTGLGFISEALTDVTVNANLTIVQSDVQTGSNADIYIPGVGPTSIAVVDRNRPLQGQSPYVANLGLTWFQPATGWSASVLYNRFGDRIDAVGGQATPDILEQGRNQLDIVLEAPLVGGWKAKVSGTRLLGNVIQFTQGGGLLRSWDQGRVVSLGFSWGSNR